MRTNWWLLTLNQAEYARLLESGCDAPLLSLRDAGTPEIHDLSAGDECIVYLQDVHYLAAVLTVEECTQSEGEGRSRRLKVCPQVVLPPSRFLDPIPLFPYLRLSRCYPAHRWQEAFGKPLQRLSKGDLEFLKLKMRQAGHEGLRTSGFALQEADKAQAS